MSTADEAQRTPLDAPPIRQARALGEPTRHRIFRAIVDADEALDVPTLTELVGLHHTAVRGHLAVLRDAGLVVEFPEHRTRPGRPRLLYRPHPELDGAWDAPDHYRWLALLLAAASGPGRDVRETGRDAARFEVVPDAPGPIDRFTAWAAGLGFDPVLDTASGDEECADVVLRHCPVADAAAQNADAVCTLHLGLGEGVAERIGGLAVEGLAVRDPHRAGCRFALRCADGSEIDGGSTQ